MLLISVSALGKQNDSKTIIYFIQVMETEIDSAFTKTTIINGRLTLHIDKLKTKQTNEVEKKRSCWKSQVWTSCNELVITPSRKLQI